MARAIIGTGNGFGSAPKIKLDDDCGAVRGCGCGTHGTGEGPEGPGAGELDHLPMLAILLRQRTGYDADGVPEFDWVEITKGRSIVYEVREEWDADIGATVVKARFVIPNPKQIDLVPETAIVVEKAEDLMWSIKTTKVTPDRIEIGGYRVWREVTGQPETLDEIWDGGRSGTTLWDQVIDGN